MTTHPTRQLPPSPRLRLPDSKTVQSRRVNTHMTPRRDGILRADRLKVTLTARPHHLKKSKTARSGPRTASQALRQQTLTAGTNRHEGKNHTMALSVERWWSRIDIDAKQWLREHQGATTIPDDVQASIIDAGGPDERQSLSDEDWQFISTQSEAVD